MISDMLSSVREGWNHVALLETILPKYRADHPDLKRTAADLECELEAFGIADDKRNASFELGDLGLYFGALAYYLTHSLKPDHMVPDVRVRS